MKPLVSQLLLKVIESLSKVLGHIKIFTKILLNLRHNTCFYSRGARACNCESLTEYDNNILNQ